MDVDFRRILELLKSVDAEFIVVGAVGAVLQGSPVNTYDLDVVHNREPGNVERLLGALQHLDAVYRAQPSRQLRPQSSHLTTPGHTLLLTRFGPLDLLGMIGHGHEYEQLLPFTIEVTLQAGLTVQVLRLDRLIAIKEETATEKDLATLAILRRTWELSQREQPL